MRKILLLAVLMAVTSVQAQRRGCLHSIAMTRSDNSELLPEPYEFDSQKTYRVPVVLFSFSDLDFSMDDPATYYNRIFNESGFNEGKGKDCVADYFRDQSAGRLNLQFDIYGPVKIDKEVRSHYYNDHGNKDMGKALSLLSETIDADFTVYDWNGDGQANEVIFIAAGRKFMGKAITNILQAADGTISFDFMKGEDTGIETMSDVRCLMSDENP